MDDIQAILDKNKKPKPVLNPEGYGNIPPQAIELEEAVLGAIMFDSNALVQVSDFLKPEMFYKPNSQKIYHAITELDKAYEPVDMLSVVNKLKDLGDLDSIGGPYAIAQITSKIGSAHNIQSHARVVQEKFMQRELIRVCSDAIGQAFDSIDVFELYNKLFLDLEKVSTITAGDISASARMKSTKEYIDKAYNSDSGLGGISTGFKTLDDYLGGLIPGDLIVMGGLPGAYKTALTLSILHNVAKQNVPVLMFEQEMSDEQTGVREIAKESGIPINRLKTGNLSNDEIEKMHHAIGLIERRPVFIDTTSGINTGYIRTVSRKYIKENKVGLIVVDYLQLMEEDGKKTQEQVLDMTVKQLKILAKQFKVPIILLSAFNDNAYRDTTQPPKANSLKGSRAIGAHADAVIFLWNPSKDNPGFVYEDGRGSVSTDNKLGIIFNKNRQGDTGLRWLSVIPETNSFNDETEF